MDAITANMLQGLIRKEGRSLLQYVSESFPWTDHKNNHALPTLLEIAREEREGTGVIVNLLRRNRVPAPYLGAYPMSFTTINYTSLDFLVPYLIDFEKRRIAEIDRDLAEVNDVEAREQLKTLSDMKQRHLQTLTNLAGTEKPAA